MTATTMTPAAPAAAADSSCQNCGWEPGPGALWPTYGRKAVRWIEANCICGEGDFYGQLVVLRPDQKAFVYRWYEYCPVCDWWHYDEAIRTAATGDGKTTFVAALVSCEFAGPPEIAPSSPNIIVAAASFKQADLLYSITATMLGGRDNIAKESPLCGKFEVYDTKTTFLDGRPGKIERVAAVDGTNEGGQPTLFVCDEMHEWGESGSRKARVATVIGKSTKKRRMRYELPQKNGEVRVVYRGPGRQLSLSTAGFDIDHSLFGEMIKYARLARHEPTLAPRLLFDCFEAPDGLDLKLPEHRRIAVAAASRGAGILWDIEARVREWDNPKTPKHEWERYYANRWVEGNVESWLADNPGAWDECEGSWQLAGDEPGVLAVDMALTRDSVAVDRIQLLADGRYAVTSRIWYPADNKLPYVEIFDYIREQAGELGTNFRGLVYDPRFFELQAQLLEDDGFLVIQFDQSPVRMIPAVGLVFDLIVAGTIVHDGHPELRRQVKNAAKRQFERGFTLSKSRSKIRIDAAVAMCMGVWSLAELAGGETSVLDQIW
jgi:phage terminase large subunit-like protein